MRRGGKVHEGRQQQRRCGDGRWLPSWIGNGSRQRPLRWIVAAAGVLLLLFGLAAQSGHGAERTRAKLATQALAPDKASAPGPLTLPETQLEPIDWSALDGWA